MYVWKNISTRSKGSNACRFVMNDLAKQPKWDEMIWFQQPHRIVLHRKNKRNSCGNSSYRRQTNCIIGNIAPKRIWHCANWYTRVYICLQWLNNQNPNVNREIKSDCEWAVAISGSIEQWQVWIHTTDKSSNTRESLD